MYKQFVHIFYVGLLHIILSDYILSFTGIALDGVQLHCSLILATQANAVEEDLHEPHAYFHQIHAHN